MKNGSLRKAAACLSLFWLLLASPFARGQTETQPKSNCNQYRLDKKTNRIVFNDPRVIIMMPSKEDLQRLRAQGTPGQVFLMKSCDAPDVMGEVKVFQNADRGSTAETIPSATRVVILEARGDWVKVKGYTSLWKGTGWVKEDDKILVVEF